jgi:nucleotide-binding universal stress UspA family protein
MTVFRRILVPTDFSAQAEAAWETARRLARALGAEVLLVHVAAETPLYSEGVVTTERVREVFEASRGWAERTLGQWADRARTEGLLVKTALRAGVPHREIVAAAGEVGADLIVIGTHGRGGVDRALLGSVADRVIRLAPCPVLAVRAPAA